MNRLHARLRPFDGAQGKRSMTNPKFDR
jgi:hypothetical protein